MVAWRNGSEVGKNRHFRAWRRRRFPSAKNVALKWCLRKRSQAATKVAGISNAFATRLAQEGAGAAIDESALGADHLLTKRGRYLSVIPTLF